MVKVTPLEEAVNRYAESALISAVRLRRYWLSQGLTEDQAIDRAITQASGMIASSGASTGRLAEIFLELEGACDTFVRALGKSKASNGIRKKGKKNG